METEPSSAPITTTQKRTPWGLFIGLFLILVVIVASALYALDQRIAVQHPNAVPTVVNQ